MSPPPRVLPNPSRRLWLWAPACLFALHGAAVGALPFDRKAENLRYRQWLAGFKQDLSRLRRLADPGAADLDSLFAGTLVPGSRATRLVGELAQASAGASSGSARDGGIERAFLAALSDAVVAGDGGDYPQTETGSRRPPQPLRVRYMHVDGGGRLERYFNDPEIFKPYRLPAPGVLTRDAYPFLLFETREGHLRLGGVSREFWELVRFMDGLSYA
ncbi:hypothetical protein [Achromobacter denitrificans]|uniref:hypothetical protein n=1 Tax=Achromobacter denitrificans TaxID=32002 RepID=UPI0023E813DB|nr:hypothetical protein [Achromobacter denitrificans]MDF3848927.1 hypothetical protein [Achromobacter denitrificans]